METVEIKELEIIKKKIETAKTARDKAEGAMERVKEVLKTEFNAVSVKDANEKLAEMEAEIVAKNARIKELMEELNALTDWDSI